MHILQSDLNYAAEEEHIFIKVDLNLSTCVKKRCDLELLFVFIFVLFTLDIFFDAYVEDDHIENALRHMLILIICICIVVELCQVLLHLFQF